MVFRHSVCQRGVKFSTCSSRETLALYQRPNFRGTRRAHGATHVVQDTARAASSSGMFDGLLFALRRSVHSATASRPRVNASRYGRNDVCVQKTSCFGHFQNVLKTETRSSARAGVTRLERVNCINYSRGRFQRLNK